jgi:LPS export ABC transporter protein LptC
MNRARYLHLIPRQLWAGAIVLSTAVILLLAVAGCGERRSVGIPPSSGEVPDQEVRDYSLTGTNLGAVEWKLYAQYAAIYDVRNTITTRGVRVDFYDSEGKPSSQLTAREGEINQLSRDMAARGNVVLQNSNGTRMSTQSVRYLSREQKIVSDELVRLEEHGNVLTAVGFESDPDLKHYHFRSRVQAVVRPRAGELPGSPRGSK